MQSCQSSLISFSIGTNMLFVAKRQIQNCLLNNFKASFFPHALCTVNAIIIRHSEGYFSIVHTFMMLCWLSTYNWCGIQHHSSHPINENGRLGHSSPHIYRNLGTEENSKTILPLLVLDQDWEQHPLVQWSSVKTRQQEKGKNNTHNSRVNHTTHPSNTSWMILFSNTVSSFRTTKKKSPDWIWWSSLLAIVGFLSLHWSDLLSLYMPIIDGNDELPQECILMPRYDLQLQFPR